MNILIVTHAFPPLATIAAQRPYSWARYWQQHHRVCVLTTEKAGIDGPMQEEFDPETLAKTRVEAVRYLPFFLRQQKKLGAVSSSRGRPPAIVHYQRQLRRRLQLGSLFSVRNLWISPAVRRGLHLHAESAFDLVVSTYGPAACHAVASTLKRLTGVRWVADYRDLWFGETSAGINPLLGQLQKRYEERLLSRADLVSAVTEPMATELSQRFGTDAIAVENGFEVGEVPTDSTTPFPADGRVRLAYLGTIYPGKRDPTPVFRAIALLRNRGIPIANCLEVLFYGANLGNLDQLIQQHGVGDVVSNGGFISRTQSLKIQRHVDALLFLDWNDSSASGILTGKIFEYISSGRPILGIASDTTTAAGKLIAASNTGLCLGNDVEEIARVLSELVAGKSIVIAPNWGLINQYTRENKAREFLQKVEAALPGCVAGW